MVKKFWFYLTIFGIAVVRLFREKLTYRASALAFTTLLALVPLLTVIVSIIAVFPFFNKLIALAHTYIVTNFLPTSGSTIEHYLENFIQQTTHLSKIGIGFLLFTAITLLITVEHTINEIWGAKQRKKKITAILFYWIVILLMPILLGLGVFLSSYLFSLTWIAGATHKLGLDIPLLSLLPLAINTAMFSLLYIAVPNCHVPWRDGLLGGFIAAILFEVAKKGFAFYIQQFPSYALIYGALATVPIFLIWIYISWLIILFGALVTHTRFQKRAQ